MHMYMREPHSCTCVPLQSLLQAVGVGAKNSLPAAAGINWVLKDGLGRLGRLSVSTRFGTSFDSDLKVRFSEHLPDVYVAVHSMSMQHRHPD